MPGTEEVFTDYEKYLKRYGICSPSDRRRDVLNRRRADFIQI